MSMPSAIKLWRPHEPSFKNSKAPTPLRKKQNQDDIDRHHVRQRAKETADACESVSLKECYPEPNKN
jgi:hypothetical protein